MEKIESSLQQRLSLAEEGRLFWNQFTKEHALDRTKMVILMPGEGADYHEEVFLNLADFAASAKLLEVIILTEEASVMELADSWKEKLFPICKLEICRIERETVDALLVLNQLYRFTNRLIIDAYEQVEDTDAGRLIGTNGITKRDVVRISILGMAE